MFQAFQLQLPATSANLGSGFDVFGMSLNLHNSFRVSPAPEMQIRYRFHNCQGLDGIFEVHKNLVITTYVDWCKLTKQTPKSFLLEGDIAIPMESGLGSSSTAIVGGLAIAHQLHLGEIDKQRLGREAAVLEGHVDNVLPCIYGGFQGGYYNQFKYAKFSYTQIAPWLYCTLVKEPQSVNTAQSRKKLPEDYKREDVVQALSNVALTMQAFERQNYALLREIQADPLHEQYRQDAGFHTMRQKLIELGAFSLTLSGSGPSYMILHTKDSQQKILSFLRQKYKDKFPHLWCQTLHADNQGMVFKHL